MTAEERLESVRSKLGSRSFTEWNVLFVEAFREAVAEEREACAMLAEYEADNDAGFDATASVICLSIAAAIRARGAK